MIRLKSSILIGILVIIFNQNVSCDEEGFFTVVGSNLLKYQKSYRVSVAHQGYNSDKILQIGVRNTDKDTKKYENLQNVTLSGDGVQNVDFDLKSQTEGDYIIEVKSVTGDKFSSFKKLHMNTKRFSVFIQTDKSVYKPKDNVKFRIMVLDSETRPFEFESIDVFVTDGGDNRVKQYENVKKNFIKGVYQNELQLSDQPVMGSWKIHVKVNSEDTVKSFDVDEYVLPTFEVTIDANPDANFKDGVIRATVKAKYTFGKIAKGNATIIAEASVPRWGYRPWGSNSHSKKVSKTVEVDGKNFVEFDVIKELEMKESSYYRRVNLFATFTEQLSGKEANASKTVEVHKTPHKMSLTTSADRIKPGLPFKVTADIRFHDKNTPVNDKFNPVNFTVSYFYDVPRMCKRRLYNSWRPYHTTYDVITPIAITLDKAVSSDLESADAKSSDVESPTTSESQTTTELPTTEPPTTTTTPETTTPEVKYEEYECREEKSYDKQIEVFIKNGNAEIDIEIPSNTTHIRVKAQYLSNEESLYYISKVDSESNEFIQAKLTTDRPSLSDTITIQVLSTSEISQLTYEVVARGALVDTKVVKFDPTKEYSLNIKPQMAMLPKAKIVIYYITKVGELVSDKVEVEFGNELTNYINLKLSAEQAKPGDNLTISVRSNPNSFVGLLGVDQSVLLLKKGNDIEQETVFSELKSYGDVDKWNYEWYDNYDYNQRYGDFDSSDAFIITNAKKPYEAPYLPYYYDEDFLSIRDGGPVYYAMPMAASLESDTFDSAPIAHKEVLTTTRPFGGLGIAGPPAPQAAFNRGGSSPEPKPIEIRKEFPETWLFDSLDFDSSDKQTLTKKVPDTITSWIITGFSLNPLTGLGLTKQSSKLNVFQPFFVSTNLPYSIKRGEVVSIPIIVFNYLESDQDTVVTLFNNDRDFEFVEVNDDENAVKRSKRGLEMERKKEIIVKSNEGVSVPFMIRPLKAGHITIKVVAESKMAGDGLEKQLKVEPEGVPQYLNEAVLIDLRSEKEFKKTIDIVVPPEAVPDSTRIEASAIGDILGPSIENLDKLIKLPYGCGEQNMLNFVPNIVVLDYLTNLNKLNPQIEEKAKKYMEVGYQKELTYKHDNGSYSAFGKSDTSGSTWLTAFVAKSFNQAAKYINIDQAVVDQALHFLSSIQTENGSFPEVGHVSHQAMQGGASKGIALTAYTLITFLEAKDHNEKYKDVINKALNYVIENLDQLNDTYSLAIANYALQLNKHEQKDMLLAKLNAKAENKDGMKYWKKDEVKEEDTNPWYYRPNTVNVEMSAYALQAFILADQDNEAVPIMKWLVTQRNENGGFQSTQDTVVGLQALSKLATKIHVADSDLQIVVKPEHASGATINVNSDNSLILQKYELPSKARHFEVSATGKGFSILQISYKYNLDNSGKYPRFVLNPKVDESSNKEYLDLHVCTNFVPDSQTARSNMAVMEVSLPSGFTFDNDHLSELMATENVKKVETKDGDTVVMVYFDDIGASQICPEFKAYRTHAVAKQKPAPIIIYDYYDNSRHARSFYNPPEISLCDICEGADECMKACEVPTVEIV
ncbi:CD109 antigen-like [Chironomus tepperi]|uniref:CD109 antigen-like n=1 Tax=Chironomus tepperi TaxID=113505 RepID=UPI00391EE7C7